MNILLYTQVYPDEPGTKTLRSSSVCHYWTKEWVKLGHKVVVIYCYPNYNYIFHLAAKMFPQFISQFTNGTITGYTTKTLTYNLDSVTVLKIPMRKLMPKIRYSQKQIDKIICTAKSYIDDIEFNADLIVSHFDNPILEIAGIMKDVLNVPFTFVLHGYPSDIKRLYPTEYRELINKVDAWGFRSRSIKHDFELQFGKLDKTFIAYSGVPDSYIDNMGTRTEKKKGSICYVGALIKRKYPEKVLEATHMWLKDGSMSLTYIGQGALSKTITNMAVKYDVFDNIRLLGQISRENVQKELEYSDMFVMISRHETFGMVYLEAMAHGCITIAAKNEGFDGVIEDGVNGFLCEAGNADELKNIILKIRVMQKEELNVIRQNAINTAYNMTEMKMAKRYLDDVTGILKSKGIIINNKSC